MFDDPEELIGLLNIAAESAIKGVEVLANASSSKILGGDSVLRSKTDNIVDGDGDVYPWGWNHVHCGSVRRKLVTRGRICHRNVLLSIKVLKICSRSS